MKFLLKYVLFPILLLLVAFALFYFWASGSQLEENELSTLVKYESPRQNHHKDTFRVMTYNIGYLSGMTNNLPVVASKDLHSDNLTAAISFLKNSEADFIGMQEVDYAAKRSYMVNQLDSLAKYCDYGYGAKAVNWDKKYVPFPYWPPSVHFGETIAGQALLSKYPVLETKRIAMDKPESAPFYYKAFYLDRLIQVSTVDVGQPLVVLNVHLEAFDTETREKQAKYLMDVFNKYASDYPVLLIGDFNARPPFASETVTEEMSISSFLDAEGIASAITKTRYGQNEKAYFTFDTEEPYEMIDYIFYTEDKIKMINAGVSPQAGQISDHLPVWMDFVLIE